MMYFTKYQEIEALFILVVVAAALKTMVLSCEIVIVALWDQPSAPHHHDLWAP